MTAKKGYILMNKEELIRKAAVSRGQTPEYSYDDACRRGYAYQGYGIDELLKTLLVAESERSCDQCGIGDCTHSAAKLVLDEMGLAWN